MSSNSTISRAIGLALGTATAAGASLAFAPTAMAADPKPTPDVALEEIVVTGSRIRRVDAETASPIYVIDQAAIQQSGITTIGDLVQRIPSISGAATNPAVNNGGGFGESNIELRGLDPKRTLILVDGRRVGVVGATANATDVNQIPINLIERVEVLKEGAGAIYGSDAIAGVVNFITRKNVDGLEIHGDYGRTSRKDGAHHSFDVIMGTSTEKFKVVAGGSYQKQDAVFNGARDFSKYALYLYGGTYGSYQSGSSRTPNGRISLPSGSALRAQFGCKSITRIGTPGSTSPSGGSIADYRCFNSSFIPGQTDRFNYQPFNLDITNLERANAFTKVDYDINEFVSAYASLTYNHTHSANEMAPLPFDAPVDDIVISKNSLYNPFGIDFGGLSGANPSALWRLTGLADRRFVADSDSADLNGGLKGKLATTGWEWDLNVTYSRLEQIQKQNGYYTKTKFQNAVGPSFLDPTTGVATCGSLASPISDCTPLNIFNIFAPGQQGVLNGLATSVTNRATSRYKNVSLDFNGKIIDLPAGALQAAVGANYAGQEGLFEADGQAVANPPLYLSCGVSNEACTGNTRGSYNSKEIYLEVFAPLLKDLPGVKSLNIDLGVRHSEYSLFGPATKSEFKLEYKPISDLLVRGTFAQVFRIPTINDVFQSPVNTSVTFNDPCQSLTSAALAANPNLALACQGVAPDSNFKEANGQITGLNTSNPKLKPESGTVKTFGLVYDPSYVPNLSVDIDYWKYEIKDLITQLDSNYSIKQCVATGSPEFCSLVQRFISGPQSGNVLVFQQPTFNLGTLKTDGIDIGAHYGLKNTKIGSFQFGFDLTRINSYLNTPAPGAKPQEIVGTYSKQFGNYARYRGLGSLGWNYAGFDGLLTARYIHKLVVTDPAVSHLQADLVTPYPDLPIGSYTYVDLTLGYSFPTKTKIQFGVRNLGDKQPPIMYQNNVVNSNTDVNTYDTLGRQWWVGFTQKL